MDHRTRLCVFAGVPFALAGCTATTAVPSGPAGTESPQPGNPAEPDALAKAYFQVPSIEFDIILQSSNRFDVTHHPDRHDAMVVNSDSDIRRFLVNRPLASSADTLPPIEFATRSGVLLVLDVQPYDAVRLEIAAIEERPDRFIVYPVKVVPDLSATLSPIAGVPACYVATKKLDKPVEFGPLATITASARKAVAQPR